MTLEEEVFTDYLAKMSWPSYWQIVA